MIGGLDLTQPTQVLLALSCGATAIGFLALAFSMVITRALLGAWATALREWE